MSLGKLNSVGSSSIGKANDISSSSIGKVGITDLTSNFFYRFYFPSTGTPDVSPAYSSIWDNLNYAARRTLVGNKINSDNSGIFMYAITSVHGWALARQYVSSSLAAQTVTAGTVKGQIRCAESNWNYNGTLYWNIRICDSSGNITQTVVSNSESNNEIAPESVWTNRKINNAGSNRTYSQFTVNAGDRLVIELGVHTIVDTTYLYQGGITVGDASSTDLPEDETTTTAYNPWIEFSSGIYLS